MTDSVMRMQQVNKAVRSLVCLRIVRQSDSIGGYQQAAGTPRERLHNAPATTATTSDPMVRFLARTTM
jgi:hypothetical protein